MCVVVYPQERKSGTRETMNEMEEQQKPIIQPTPIEPQDPEEPAQP